MCYLCIGERKNDMENSSYLIRIRPASYLSNKEGWGPTFTMFIGDAKRFPTEKAAEEYINAKLKGFGCDIVHSV